MKLTTILRYIVLAGLFIIPFIPLVVANSYFFPFITGKGFTFRIIVEIIFGAWVALALIHPGYRPQKSWILWSWLAFTVIIALADFMGVNPYKSFWSNYERMEGLITLLHLGAYFLVASTVLSTERLWNWFWNTTIIASLIVVFYSFLQLIGTITINQGSVRVDATFGNATYLSVYMLFHIFITLFLIISNRHFLLIPQIKTLYSKVLVGLPIMLLQFVVLYKTATRGTMLGLIVSVLLVSVLVVTLERQRRQFRKIAFGFIVATVVIVLGFLAIKNTRFVQTSPVLSRFATISLKDNTTISRFVLGNMAIQGFKERPVLGWGQENFNYVFNKYYEPRLYGQEQWFDRTHNVITDWLIAGGILGLLAYLSFYIAILWHVWKSRTEEHFTTTEKSVITGLLVAYFIHNFFVFDNLISYIFFLSIAAYVYSRTTEGARAVAHERAHSNNRFIIPVALIATILILYTVNARPIAANTTLIQALQTQPSKTPGVPNAPYNGDVTPNLQKFKAVIGYNTFGSSEAREQLLGVAETVATSQYPITGRDELLRYAVEQMDEQIKATPNDARYYVLFGAFLSRVGQAQVALPYLTKAVELSPRKQTILFELGSAYATLKQYPQAEQTMKKAFDLDPSYEVARILYGASAIYNGHEAEAQNVLKPLATSTLIKSDYILQAYYNTGKNTKVVDILKQRVELAPNDPQSHLSLAAGYLLIKDRANAIKELEKAKALYPGAEEQIDQYIKDIKAGKNP
jgi:tetratricopeptide (TPR) repeat protein/O-antigen ligase